MRRLIRTSLLAASAVVALPGIASAAWVKTYAIEWMEAASYYGAKEGTIAPGSDCPTGVNPEPNWIEVLTKAGYTEKEASWLRDPANPTRSAVNGQPQMAFRGTDRANVYLQPTTTPDPGLVTMSGSIAEGVNLDNNTKTGFVSPTGQKGIDNAFYKTTGCWKTYRGPPRLSSGAMQFNDVMRNGAYTVVIVATGKGKDPMNDNDVQLGFYMSQDKLVKDGGGGIAGDYTFRIKPDAKFEAVLKGKTVKGEIIAAADEIWMRDPGYTRELQLLKAKSSLHMQPDGSLKGFLGGYRPWYPVYKGWVDARGPVIESLTWVELPGVYYALQRNADYSPTGPKGERTHISSAMRIDAVPAFVVEPDAKDEVVAVKSYKDRIKPAAQAAAPAAMTTASK